VSGKDRVSVSILYGWHPVYEALKNKKRRCRRLLGTRNALQKLEELLPKISVATECVNPRVLDRLLPRDAVHQGLYLEADPLPEISLELLPETGFFLALDQITDPHNVGAIIRTAAAFNVDGLIITNRHAPHITGVLAKAASGGLEYVPLCVVANLGNALLALKERHFSCIGLDSEADRTLSSCVPISKPVVLILGAEGKGLRARTRSACTMARIDLPGALISLNVSNAAAIALNTLISTCCA
jgi:23S rRNA (guanosine2251-2'-O)-methyltransferase